MTNMLLATALLSDKALLSSSSSVAAQLPLTNLKRMAIGAPTRFLTPDSCHVLVDMGVPTEVNFLALLGHNATAAGQCQVRGASSVENLDSSPLYDSGLLSLAEGQLLEKNHFMIYLEEPVTARYWQFDFADDSVPYIDVGRLYVGKAFEPETNMSYGLQEGFIDPSTLARTVSGRVIPNERPRYRYADFQLSFGTEQEMFTTAFNLDLLCGMTKDVLFVQDYSNKSLLQKRTIYGNMRSLSPIINTSFQRYEKRYRVEEIIA